MRIQVAIPEPHVTAPVLNAALEGVTRLNERLIRSGDVPPYEEVKDQLRWKPEPPGAEHFDHAATLLNRGWGDCDDLGPYKAASDRVTGLDRGAKAVVRRSGPSRWHCYVQHSDGSTSDPSKECGMPGPGAIIGVRGAAQPLMFSPLQTQGVVGGTYIDLPQVAMRPIGNRWGQVESWQARADLPWHYRPGRSPADIAMVSLHRSPISDQALVGALVGAIRLGEEADEVEGDDLDRMEAIVDACHGATWEELADEYGPEHATAAGVVVGSFFGDVFKKVSRAIKNPEKTLNWAVRTATMPARVALRQAGSMLQQARPVAAAAMPLAQAAAPFIPGIGPLASMAFQAASPMLQQLLQSGANMPPPQYAAPQQPPMPWASMALPTGGMPWG